MDPDLLLNLFTVLEIIVVEFLVLQFLAKRKHSLLLCMGSYALITVLIVVFMFVFAVRHPSYGDGSGRFMYLGALYFIPAVVNYREDIRTRLISAFLSFSYGLAIFALSVRISYLFPNDKLALFALVIQTILYLITFYPFIRYARAYIMVYIRKADKRQKNLFLQHVIFSFILIITYNRMVTAASPEHTKLISYVVLVYFVFLTYQIMVSYLRTDENRSRLLTMATVDKLTQLGNRVAFRQKISELFEAGRPFNLIFMDLITLKQINDCFGHTVGDLYLYNFAHALQGLADGDTSFYRYSGDEFICLTQNPGILEKL